MTMTWQASSDIFDLLNAVKNKFHKKRLEEAEIAISLNQTKPFIKGRLNLGKTSKFSPIAKIWHPRDKQFDFHISICADVWVDLLNDHQKEAILDLHLTRCDAEFIPQIIEENGKKQKVVDDFGRIQYSEEMKRDAEGNPKWKVNPIDIITITDNISRYGLWYSDLVEMGDIIKNDKKNN